MLRKIILLAALLLLITSASAQAAPEQINAALVDLSSRVGRTVTLADLSRWSWEQGVFDDTSLGCPESGQTYNQQQIVGFIFNIEYAGTIYEYRVSNDQTIIRLCEQRSATDPTATPLPEDQYSNALCPQPPTGLTYIRSRITSGIQAVGVLQVNRLRQQPSTDAPIIAEIPQNAVFTVLAGPECDAEGFVWWQVDYDGTTGWTAEGQGEDRFVIPQPPNALPIREVINAENAAQAVLLSRIQGNIIPALDFSPDGVLLAVPGDTGSDSLHLYQLEDLDSLPRYLDGRVPLASIDYHPNGLQVLMGSNNGSTMLWNIAPDATVQEALYLNTHVRDVIAVAVYPDGSRFASAGFDAQVAARFNRTYAINLWQIDTVSQVAVFDDPGAAVTDIDFSPLGSQMAAVDGEGNIWLWNIDAPDEPLTLEGVNASSVAYSPNGQFLAVGSADGSIRLIETLTTETITTLTGHLGLITEMAFSPDATILASVSGDGTLRLWSTQTDENLLVIEVSEDGVFDVAFAPDGSLVAAASEDNAINFYGIAQS